MQPAAATLSLSASTSASMTNVNQPSLSISALPLAASTFIRSAVLNKFQSKLTQWLKSLQSIGINLGKSKRIRSLVKDLEDEILTPLLKFGFHPSEVDCLMRLARDVIGSMPSMKSFHIANRPRYPYAYDRRRRLSSSTTTMTHATAAPSNSTFNFPSASHQTMLHFCRYLDAVGPICCILYRKMNHTITE